MTLDIHAMITGGIPPDPDQVVLMTCSWRDCGAHSDKVPLVVVAIVGKMAVLCPLHYKMLAANTEG